jgi:hypothetical protein
MLTFSCCLVEASLVHLEVVSSRLAETQQELQKEVDALQSELKISQDPERMSVIQEMISVGILINWLLGIYTYPLVGLTGPNVTYSREGNRVRGSCEGYH